MIIHLIIDSYDQSVQEKIARLQDMGHQVEVLPIDNGMVVVDTRQAPNVIGLNPKPVTYTNWDNFIHRNFFV